MTDWDRYDSIRFEESEYAYSRAMERRRNERPETESQAKVRRTLQEQKDRDVRESVNCGPWGDGE